MSRDNRLPKGGVGIMIVDGKDCKIVRATTRNMENHVAVVGGRNNEVIELDARNSPRWEEKRQHKRNGFLDGIASTVIGGGILRWLGWA